MIWSDVEFLEAGYHLVYGLVVLALSVFCGEQISLHNLHYNGQAICFTL